MTELPQQGDDVLVTGTASSPNGVQYVRLYGHIATVSRDGHVKVWPHSEDGEVWFPLGDVTELVIVRHDE